MYNGIKNVTLNFSEHCNLKCNYCYISHSKFSVEKNEVIREKIKNLSFINDIKYYFGDDIEDIGLWGSEPSLNLDVFTDIFPEVLKNFKKLKSINFSTNLSGDIHLKNIKYFIENIRKIWNGGISIQVSIDGPKTVHEHNRGKFWDKITTNIVELVKFIRNYENISFGTKGTYDNLSNEILLNILENNEKEFDDYINYLKSINNIFRHTIVIPGVYTKNDGIIYKKLTDYFDSKNVLYDLKTDFINMIRSASYLWFDNNKVWKFPYYYGCHAGMSGFGINIYNDTISVCQHGFSFNKDEKILKEENFFDRNGIKFEKIDSHMFNEYKFVDKNKEYLYYKVNYERNTNFLIKYNLTKNFVILLAKAGQISERYLIDEKMLDYFIVYLITTRVCMAANIFSTHIAYMPSEGVVKLYANGAFEKIYDNYMLSGGNIYNY